MYEAIEHWKQYKLEKSKVSKKQTKFDHLKVFSIVLDVTYIVSFISLFTFTIIQVINH